MKQHNRIYALRQLKPTAGFHWKNPEDYSSLKYFSTDDAPTEVEINEQAKTSESVEAMDQLRSIRNNLLKETDWWASSDLTMTSEQTAYRKALRDLPSTASPELDSDGQLTGVTWPENPE